MEYVNECITVIETDALKILPLKYVKNYLRIDNDCDDGFLLNAVATAINYAQMITGKIFGTNTFKLNFTSDKALLKIDKTPILIDEVLNLYVNNKKIEENNFKLKNGIIVFDKSISGEICVVFKAGIPIGQILADIKQAMLYHVASIYQNKDGGRSVPKAAQEIYNLYRKVRL